jgi:hypothetical protein
VMDGHAFSKGVNALTGRTTPWNTFAVWSVRHLALTGFPMIGDGVGADRAMGGVEEVSAINLLQKVNPELKAVLVRFTSHAVQWNTRFDDPERQKYHDRKMQSKNERPAKQMAILGIAPGQVFHAEI